MKRVLIALSALLVTVTANAQMAPTEVTNNMAASTNKIAALFQIVDLFYVSRSCLDGA